MVRLLHLWDGHRRRVRAAIFPAGFTAFRHAGVVCDVRSGVRRSSARWNRDGTFRRPNGQEVVYFVSYATRNLQVPLPTTLALLQGAAILFAASIVFFASRSDRRGRRRMMRWSCAAVILTSLVFFPLVDTQSLPLMALAVGSMLVAQGVYIGPQAAVFAELFPAAVRYSGASLSITLGTVFGGAIAPFVATALYSTTGTSWPVTASAVALSLISWVCVLGLKETFKTSL